MRPANQHRAWQPSKVQNRIDKTTRRAADREGARIPWRQFLKARQLYVECQAFLLWVRAIEDSEGHFPERLVEIVPKRFPGFLRFAEQQSVNDRGKSLAALVLS